MSIESIEIFTDKISPSGCGKLVKNAVFPCSLREAEEVLRKYEGRRFLIAGGLTNTLVGDIGEDIMFFSDGFRGLRACQEGICVRAGEKLSHVVHMAKRYHMTGLEALWGVPGTIGGAVMGNAGCYGTEIFDLVESVKVFRLDDGKTENLYKEEIVSNYRYTNLRKNIDFIYEVQLRLSQGNERVIEEKMADILRKRKLRLPEGKSLGSVYKKENGISAGYYIEKAGLKGKRVGGIQISEKHANVFINVENGTVEDFYALMLLVEKTVWEKTGVKLQREVVIFGEHRFDC